jgi:hypothetical protein
MKKLYQEDLKLLACVTMLIDHIGAALFPQLQWLRLIGRLAFPIYCFLLAEGVRRTKNPRLYGLRLALGAVLAEWPFDVLFFGKFTWQHQSVMVTLLLGFFMLQLGKKRPAWRIGLMAVFMVLAQLLEADYGAYGILVIAAFAWVDDKALQALALAAAFWMMPSTYFCGVPMQMFALLALLPIWCYSGKKRSAKGAVQWGFYLFYPAHMALLLLLR